MTDHHLARIEKSSIGWSAVMISRSSDRYDIEQDRGYWRPTRRSAERTAGRLIRRRRLRDARRPRQSYEFARSLTGDQEDNEQ